MNEYERLTIMIDSELADKCRNIVYFEPSLTLKSFVEKAIEKQVEIWEEVHGGTPPPRPTSKLIAGRPLK